jgi:cytochrome c oxidase assembly protein subunit 15
VNHLRGLIGTPTALCRIALASIVANVGIVITGGAVRLTGSGLGCPTWPRCTEDSYTATAAMGVNGAIEFGNRLLTFAVGLVALLGIVSALLQRPPRRRTVALAAAVFAGIPAQALVGGVTVLTDLNPWVVGCHFLVSMAVIAGTYALWRAARADATPLARPDLPTWTPPRALRVLAALTLAASAAVLVLGVVVTGSGPHAGDADAKRTGLDPEAVSQLHADGVFLLLGLTVGLLLATRALAAPRSTARAAAVLLGVEFAQGVIGVVQYVTGLPVLLVAAHMAGACAVWLASLAAYANVHRPAELTASARLARVAADLPDALTRPEPREPNGAAPSNGDLALGPRGKRKKVKAK